MPPQAEWIDWPVALLEYRVLDRLVKFGMAERRPEQRQSGVPSEYRKTPWFDALFVTQRRGSQSDLFRS